MLSYATIQGRGKTKFLQVEVLNYTVFGNAKK